MEQYKRMYLKEVDDMESIDLEDAWLYLTFNSVFIKLFIKLRQFDILRIHLQHTTYLIIQHNLIKLLLINIHPSQNIFTSHCFMSRHNPPQSITELRHWLHLVP
jgi:hypothetical protein